MHIPKLRISLFSQWSTLRKNEARESFWVLDVVWSRRRHAWFILWQFECRNRSTATYPENPAYLKCEETIIRIILGVGLSHQIYDLSQKCTHVHLYNVSCDEKGPAPIPDLQYPFTPKLHMVTEYDAWLDHLGDIQCGVKCDLYEGIRTTRVANWSTSLSPSGLYVVKPFKVLLGLVLQA